MLTPRTTEKSNQVASSPTSLLCNEESRFPTFVFIDFPETILSQRESGTETDRFVQRGDEGAVDCAAGADDFRQFSGAAISLGEIRSNSNRGRENSISNSEELLANETAPEWRRSRTHLPPYAVVRELRKLWSSQSLEEVDLNRRSP
ncbi:hypothetical protein AXG93_4620s1570 [Marchantia polymorpha subsp. ruderalis]|uniref:Uncharacterized protein n=1 Tax=Marchantia polymorpha subsp. ruderalis TaxID=1480154 RepID=A0A176VYK8_MARPO|nr:hypothetical protein AXG93_4620s1570 [Marchantia polymorpha subsp. ruderalis]